MAIGEDKTRIVITIPKDLKVRVDALAAADNRPTSNYIINLLLKEIEKNEEAAE